MAQTQLVLDHLAVAGETLEAARVYVEAALGVPMQEGGRHAVFHTHNALLGLEDGLYLEAIAVDPNAPVPDRPRWFDLDRFAGGPRLTNWICRTEDLAALLGETGLALGAPVDLRRGELDWKMAVPATGVLPFDNRTPAVIQWTGGGHPCDRLPCTGVRLRRLTVIHPRAFELRDALAGLFDDPRVNFETGPAGYSADFSTPRGERTLTG